MSYSFSSRGTFPCRLRRCALVLSCVALLLGCVSAQERASVAAVPSSPTATGGAGNFVGINNPNPVADLHILGVNPTMRIEQYGPVGSGDSPNFNFFTGNGTAAAPTATLDKDNLGQFAATGHDGTGFAGSKVKVSFLAVGNWTPTAKGTAMSFQTTSSTDTSVHRTERLRIGDNGNVGIGDFSVTPPPFPLTVNGIIQSTIGGFMFPNGTTQTTAGITTPSPCVAGQLLSWNGSGWACVPLPGGITLALDAAPNAGLVGNVTGNVLTLGINPTVVQSRVNAGTACSSGFAIHQINQDGSVTCVAASGSGGVSLPVTWNGTATAPNGVLTVTDTVNGPPEPNSTPTNSFFATVPSAIVGTASGTGITAGVRGQATGSTGVGVFAYTATSPLGALIAWNGVTGYVRPSNGDNPKALIAALLNETGGSVIQAEADALTAPTCSFSSNNCDPTTGVSAKLQATSGQTVGFSANMYSPLSTGLQLNFNSPLAAGTSSSQGGSIINANVNCSGTGPCTYFQVDNNANINTSGGLTANGPSNLNGQVNANNGFNAQNVNVPGQIIAQSITVQNLQVTGNLSKPQGTFKIDHPLDPANKFLYHSFVESPDMMNIYNGNIVTDKHGVATVVLPDYFEALNQDFRYQLTVIGQFAQAIVVKEISKNHFTIKTSKPSVKVSWQVTGVRHDAYAEAHRIVVEEDKGKERGTYLHPELFQKDPVVAQK
jgi:hypothetical protein